MKALYFTQFGPSSALQVVDAANPIPDSGTAIVKVVAASINPSDIKNVAGKMEHTTLPRIPGRDYAGTVISGPAEWLGAAVWGTGGEIGYSVDGSHAEYLAVPSASLRRKPSQLSFAEAASVGTTYLAGWIGVVEYAALRAGETLFVIGVAGGVGGSAAHIGNALGATVVGADRFALSGDATVGPILRDYFTTEDGRVAEKLREVTDGEGADVVFDTVGGPLFEQALRAVKRRGRVIEISSAGERRVGFDLLDFYHNETQLFGADTRKRDAVASALILERLRPSFETGVFPAPVIGRIVALADGREAYQEMERGSVNGRLVLAANPEEAILTSLST